MTNFEQKKQRLELLKMVLICALLAVILVGQAFGCRKTDVALSKIVQLQLVVQEVAEQSVCCPVDVPKE